MLEEPIRQLHALVLCGTVDRATLSLDVALVADFDRRRLYRLRSHRRKQLGQLRTNGEIFHRHRALAECLRERGSGPGFCSEADPAERMRLAHAGRARMLSHHAWPRSMQRLDAIIENACRAFAPRRAKSLESAA